MPFRPGLQALLTCLVAATTLGGCAENAPQAPGEPGPGDLGQFSTDLRQLPETDAVKLINLGYALSDQQCDQFFVKLQTARNKNQYNAAQISALATFVTPGMTLLDASAKAVGIAGGLFGFATTTALNYSKYVLLTEYDAELQDLVHSAKIEYIKEAAQNNQITADMDKANAYKIIGGYAWLCTLPGIDSLTRAALASGAQATGPIQKKAGSDQGAAAAPPPPLPRRQAPPVSPPPGASGAGPSVTVPQITVVR